MADEKSDERTAVVEAILEKHVLPMLQKMDGKLDDLMNEKASKESVKEAHDRIDEVQKELETKADKSELKEVRDKVLIWTGSIGVITIIVMWFGQKLLTMLAAK